MLLILLLLLPPPPSSPSPPRLLAASTTYTLHPFNGHFSRTTWVCRYQKGKTSLNSNQARDDRILGWQWHQLDHMQTICTSLQTDNHTNTPSHNFYRPDALPGAQPTVLKRCRQIALKANAPKFMLLTVTLIIISSPSNTHTLSFRDFTVTSQHIRCYFLVFCFTLFGCCFRAVD